jgi:F0F1-type ATP synthase assembly protein I
MGATGRKHRVQAARTAWARLGVQEALSARLDTKAIQEQPVAMETEFRRRKEEAQARAVTITVISGLIMVGEAVEAVAVIMEQGEPEGMVVILSVQME